ncbi:MAG: MmcQ/YjbR family DNA-binding protein [Clostridia bacterium]|nr:MmcQ/YjbR family DNA-binding protein [Clostridia bacterium]
MKKQNSLRLKIHKYINDKYAAEPEYLWLKFPDYAVFRHADSRKWFALIADVDREKLGLDGEGRVDALIVKIADPLLLDMLVDGKSFFRGYHMNKKSWMTVILDGSVEFKRICALIDESFNATN